MAVDIIKIIIMDLFLVNDGLKKLYAGAVPVFPAHQKELIIGSDGILYFSIKRENRLYFLSFLGLTAGFRAGFATQFLDDLLFFCSFAFLSIFPLLLQRLSIERFKHPTQNTAKTSMGKNNKYLAKTPGLR